MRVLEGHEVAYETFEFLDTIHDAREVANQIGLPPENVYKTLVVLADDPDSKPLLIMIAADAKLDLKKVARETGAKKAHMARHADAERITGLKVGGISALALLNKGFEIYINEWATLLNKIVISAGKKGVNLQLNPDDLIRVTDAQVVEVSQD